MPLIDPAIGPSREWMDEANCLGLDPDLMFPERGNPAHQAKQICAGCTVRAECLEFSLLNNERFGIWGGLSAKERLPIHRRRNLALRGA